MRGFTLVFGGLAAAVAAVIDDAVIDVDRARRRLDERRGRGRRVSAAAVVLEGATEMRSAASMLVALIVTPALSLSLLSKVRGDAHPSPLLRWRRGSSRACIPRRFRRCSPARRSLPGSREV